MTAEVILADIQSKDAARIEAALRELKRRREMHDEIDVPPLRLDVLDPYGPSAPADIQHLFLDVVIRYPRFSPPVSIEERLAIAVGLILRYGDFGSAYRLALALKVAGDPLAAVGFALQEIERDGLSARTAVTGAGYLVSNLLDGRPEIRRTVVDRLGEWPPSQNFQQVVSHVKPQLEPEEIDRLAK